ncbi:MAG: hypothetical protein AB1806_20590 [Acidobacteriota bacterium]
MRTLLVTSAAVLLLGTAAGLAQQQAPAVPSSADADRLPVTRVVLYKNGVGFFEHLGRIRGNQQVTIDFTSGQLNDVLKSLTTVDLASGKVTGVSFNTDDPASRKLEALSLPVDEETTLVQFLSAVRGARVEVTGPASVVTGRVLAVDQRTAIEQDKPVETRELVLVTDAGDVRTFDISPRLSIRLLEGGLRGDVRRYLDIVASSRQRDLRRMTISTAGSGDRQLYVSYISEVPIWKSTYRLVLPSKAGDKPLLQGWAIVDNTIGEDWAGVELSLVAGSPQSFIQQLSQPLYARRPVIPLPQSVQLSPQTHEGAVMLAKAPAETEPARREMALRAPAPAAAGRVGGVVGALAEAPPPAPAPAMDEVLAVMARAEAAAQGRELGDLFEYRLNEPVTIRKNQSALVPIINAPVEAERVSVWSATSGQRPRSAVWLRNATSYTLDGGAFSVLEDATFTGEGLMEAVKPGERRLLSYASDLALRVDARQDAPDPERVTSVRIARGVMVIQREFRDKRSYTVRNEDPKTRALIIEHPNRQGWKIVNDAKPEETASSVHRFRLLVPATSSATLVVEEMRPAETTYQVASLNDDQLALFVRQRAISADAEKALRAVLAKKVEIAAVAAEISARNAEVDRIFKDQERLRENLKALGTRAEERSLVSRYTRQLEEQETRLDTLKREIAEQEARRRQLQGQLEQMIAGISF